MSEETSSVYLGTGRRKTASARVRLTQGTGKITINGRDGTSFFAHENFSRVALQPLATIEGEEKFDVVARVVGGGNSGQAGAISLGIARALLMYDNDLRSQLKPEGVLSRDPRMKERKKAGQPGARKKFQFSKR